MKGIEIDELSLPSARKADISYSRIGSLYAPNIETAGDGFLCGCEVLATEVDLPRLVSVGKDAFAYSTFKRLSLDSLTTIGSGFMNGTHVDELYLPSLESAEGTINSETTGLEQLYGLIFQGLEAGKIVAPKIKKLSYAFDSAKLGDVDLPALETLGDNAFYKCAIGTLRMKRLTTVEGSFCLYNCSPMKVLELDSLETIEGGDNFENLNLEGTLALPSLKTISGGYNFSDLQAASASMPLLESVSGNFNFTGAQVGVSVSLPRLRSFTSIDGGFFSAASITEVSIPELETIEGKEFLAGTKIGDLYLPASLTTVSSGAVGYSWTEDQTIHVPFAEGKLPSGWASDWLAKSCKAKVVYGDVDGSAL